MNRVRKPVDFYLPYSGVLLAYCSEDPTGPFVQVRAGGTYEAKTVLRLSQWLGRATKWLAYKQYLLKLHERTK